MKKSINIRGKIIAFFLIQSALLPNTYAQNVANVFKEYQKAPNHSILPNFSYVGYHYGEKEIPKVNSVVFDVTKFGAIPNDDLSDKEAIQNAINAAEKNGGGVVFFPKGKFIAHGVNDTDQQISITSSNIVLRGSGSGSDGTELLMQKTLQPEDPKKMWTVPSLFQVKSTAKDISLGGIAANANIGDFNIVLSKSSNLKPKDWILIKLKDNDSRLVKQEMGVHNVDSTWKSIIDDGVFVRIFCQVKSVSGNKIELFSPLPYKIDVKNKWSVYQFAHVEEVGFEDLAFVGNWTDKFVHHRSWQDDSGYTLLRIGQAVNSWVINCRFTNVSAACTTTAGANISILNCKLTGNSGHEAISNNGGTNILLGKITDEAGMWHSVGVAGSSINTVIWRVSYPSNTSFETHSSQPRNTLLDCVTGGLMDGRGGGAIVNMPNHLSNLIFWNYKQTNAPYTPFDFWPENKSKYWRVVMPIIVGFTGGTTFIKDQLAYEESTGAFVEPKSLYEAQLKLRLGKLPAWINQFNK
ncbi:DUF4955 domain-containing protein [Pedobacter sp. SD-b]|uniref:DUF4955 domain-containing protein n=1 Tax=Pedobacter segetis TaxID=2793069 RepID=A0ABS1BP63_9SPHI|nr:DUF4955 domain-containing protein [Pedobacter segetis]MBK0384161.1 DUF4955 domain-containing protein [Pedobacter segetis]